MVPGRTLFQAHGQTMQTSKPLSSLLYQLAIFAWLHSARQAIEVHGPVPRRSIYSTEVPSLLLLRLPWTVRRPPPLITLASTPWTVTGILSGRQIRLLIRYRAFRTTL